MVIAGAIAPTKAIAFPHWLLIGHPELVTCALLARRGVVAAPRVSRVHRGDCRPRCARRSRSADPTVSSVQAQLGAPCRARRMGPPGVSRDARTAMRAITRRAVRCATLVLCAAAAARIARAEPPSAPDPSHWIPVQVMWDQKIVMLDGVRLSATIYRDLKQTGRLPAIMTMTPYIAEALAKRGMYFAQHGYVFVAVLGE